jgi:hypothetical protein
LLFVELDEEKFRGILLELHKYSKQIGHSDSYSESVVGNKIGTTCFLVYLDETVDLRNLLPIYTFKEILI